MQVPILFEDGEISHLNSDLKASLFAPSGERASIGPAV